jgi:hypothetical protein
VSIEIIFSRRMEGDIIVILPTTTTRRRTKKNYSPVYPPRSGIALPEEGNRPDRAVLRLDEVRHPAEGVVLVDVVAGAVVVAVDVFRCNNAAVVRR